MVLYLVQLGVNRRHHLLERGVFRSAVLLRYVLSLRPAARTLDRDLLRSADTRNHILALSVNEVLAIEDVLTRGGVARECHARGRVLAHVAEHHGLHRHCGTPLGGNVVEFAIENSALVHPRTEHGADRAPQLIPRIHGELRSRLLLHGLAERRNQLLQIVGRKVGIHLHAALFLLLVDQHLERIVILLRYGLHA